MWKYARAWKINVSTMPRNLFKLDPTGKKLFPLRRPDPSWNPSFLHHKLLGPQFSFPSIVWRRIHFQNYSALLNLARNMTQPKNKVKKAKSIQNKGFRSFLGISSWWKGRNFYFPQPEELDDTSTRAETKSSIRQQLPPHVSASTAASTDVGHGTLTSLTDWAVPLPQPQTQRQQQQQYRRYPYTRTQSFDSLHDSIESLDSVAESYGDLDDDISEATASVVPDMEYETDFLLEHLGFLTAHTQPRPFQVVYRY